MAPNTILQDVIAIIVCSDPIHNAKGAIQKRLQTNGATVQPRLTKDVTHIIFERRRSQRACDKKNEDEAVVELYRKLDGLPCPPSIVSPLWVEESITQGRRLMERRYMVARPKENLLAAAPGSAGARVSGGGTKKRKHRSSGPAPPKPAGEFDLNLESDWLFDSSQQLKEPGTGGSDAVDPLSGPKRHSRLRRTRSSARASGKLAAAATAAVTGEPTAAIHVGSSTQAVADILAIDLPADRVWSENSDDAEDLDTPLSVRMARQSSGKRQKVGEIGSAGAIPTAGKAEAKAGTAGAAKSRLAHSSKASDKKQTEVDVEEEEEEAPVDAKLQSEDEIEDDYDMDVDEALATQVEEEEPEPAPKTKPTRKQTKKPKQAAPVAIRFSMRNLHPEKQMLVNKETPLVPIKSVSIAKANGCAQDIPIPAAVRVNSPWNEPTPAVTTAATKARRPGSAAPLTFTRPRVSFGGFAVPNASKNSGGYGGGTANVFTPTLPTTLKKVVIRDKVPTPWSPRRWDGASAFETMNGVSAGGGAGSNAKSAGNSIHQNAGKPSSQQRRSRFGTQNDEEEAAAALAARALEAADVVATMPDEEEEEVVAMMEVVGADSEMPSFVPASDDDEEEKKEQENAENVNKGPKNNSPAVDGGVKKSRRKTTTTRRTAKEETQVVEKEKETKEAVKKPEEEGPKHGFIAVTSTTSGVVALCKSAVQRLRGLRFCVEGKEDGAITHLIIGDERRTMKAMLAVANGAILLDPEWITASLEAGKWVAEGPYKSKVRFAAAADRARELIASTSKSKQGLLAEYAIYIHPGQGNPAALKRVASALGASITSLKECSVCVVSEKDGEKPRGVPRKVPVVSEEWLLGAAETFRVPTIKKCTLR